MPASSVRFRFRPPWWGVLLAAAGCAAGVALGAWQQGRAAEKRAAALNVPRVALRGELLERFTVYLDNRLHRGRPGYQVVQPLRTPEGRHVLVNRGWLAAGARRGEPPRVRTPAGEVAIEGVRRERIARALEPPGAKREGAVWQNASVPAFAAWSGLTLEPWVLEQHSAL
ncbi:MAG: SURF1 family protein, partial [Pseudomonadota bacterium]